MTQRRRRLAAVTVGVGWVLALACSGESSSGDPAAAGSPYPSGATPTGLVNDMGAVPGAVTVDSPPGTSSSGPGAPVGPTPTGGPVATTTPTSAPSQGPAGLEDDPNAIPTEAPPAELVATSRLARLSRLQWANSVRQLLRLSDISDIESDVSGDALIDFDTEGDALYVTEQLRRELEVAAERLADRVALDAVQLSLLEPSDAPADLPGRARAFINEFGARAFRRPLAEDEVTTHLALFDQGPVLYPGVDEFAAGASLVIQAMLQSPHFLYRTELGVGDGSGAAIPLDDFEVASKLAFALTNTMPSDELLAIAAAGQLRDRANVVAQAEALIAGATGVDGILNFNFQVLRLGTYDGIERDTAVFPDFTPEAPASMKAEVLHFLEWAFKENRGVKDYYTAPVGFVNSALAPLYGLEGDFSADTFTQVELDPSQRSGLLTQAGFLSSYISGVDPDIIHRGVYIATRLLCIKLPPPDPNATSLVEIQPDMTNRERVEATTGEGTCGEGCHSTLLNPLGYAFENYDAVGKYRTTDRGLPVDASATYTLDGLTQTFQNGVELSHFLAESKQMHKCYAQNMLQYLHGRPHATEDQAIIDYYARLSRAGMISVQDLLRDIVTSDTFLTRLP